MRKSKSKVVSLFASVVSAGLLVAGSGGIATANPEERTNPAGAVDKAAVAEVETQGVSPIGVDAQGRTLKAPAPLTTKKGAQTTGSVPAHVPMKAHGKSFDKDSVIPPDGRHRVYNTTAFPNSAIVFIQRGGGHHCTGWMVSADTLVTAGHCLYDTRSQSWYRGLEFVPGANGRHQPYGSARAAKMWTDTSYAQTGNTGRDWGIVKLNRPVGNQTGWFGLTWREGSYNGTWSVVRGYPGDKGIGEMWTMSGQINESRPNQLCYSIDTMGGQSGSPVYLSSNQAIAIHAYGVGPHGAGGCPSQYNAGTRITKDLYELILQMR
ncbi:MAG: trypsin-like serine protease [Propionibacteriaceae bacterium]|nr:trypsin-like serine protease [Propionibacteriaceae bacterium]